MRHGTPPPAHYARHQLAARGAVGRRETCHRRLPGAASTAPSTTLAPPMPVSGAIVTSLQGDRDTVTGEWLCTAVAYASTSGRHARSAASERYRATAHVGSAARAPARCAGRTFARLETHAMRTNALLETRAAQHRSTTRASAGGSEGRGRPRAGPPAGHGTQPTRHRAPPRSRARRT